MKQEDDEVTRLAEECLVEPSAPPRFGVDWAGEARESDEIVGGEHTLFDVKCRVPPDFLPGVPRREPRWRELRHAEQEHEPSSRSRTQSCFSAGRMWRMGGGVFGALVGIVLSVLGLGLCSGRAAGAPVPRGVAPRMEPPERPSPLEAVALLASPGIDEEKISPSRRKESTAREQRGHAELELRAIRALWSGGPERALELYRELAERSEDRPELTTFVQILDQDRKERGSK